MKGHQETMEALQKLLDLEQQAVAIGCKWPTIDAIIDQAVSECDEIRQSVKLKEGQARIQEEVGDLLHAVISLCLFAKFDIDQTLTQTVEKFGARLEALQKIMKERGYSSLDGQPFEFLLELWGEAKLAKDGAARCEPRG